MSAPGRLVAVVVTYNRAEQLAITLRALLASSPDDLSAVVVVDNASTDATGDVLNSHADARLHLLRLPTNRGGAGGFDAGMRHAMAHLSPDWLVVMDDDARPEPGAFAAFHALDLTGFDGFAAAVRHPDGTLCEMNRPTLNPFWHKRVMLRTLLGGGRGAFHLSEQDFQTPGLRVVDGASFVGFFVRAHTVTLRGYPDPALFIYGDDALYTMGLTKAGHRLGFDPSVRFEHDSQTYRSDDPALKPLWKVYYYHRNLITLYRLAAGVFFWPVMALYLPKWARGSRHYGANRPAFWRLWRRAVQDGLLQRTPPPHDEIKALAEQRPR